jgi:hypothetical protein
MAIGQLADYARFGPSARKAILVPSRPRDDLERLIRGQGIELLWSTDEAFRSTGPDFV